MEISIMIEGQNGLTWPRWKVLVAEVERLGFAGLFRSDHFTNAQPPDKDSLEAWVSLAYLADHTDRIHFGPLVSPASFRHPTLLARQAAALDDLSGGRMVFGLGAGWQEREHRLFGHDLGDFATRMTRLEEALEVVTRLLRSDEPVTFEGRFYQLREASLLPRPERPGGPQILVGGNGPRRTIPLAARYADVWNGTFLTPEGFAERGAVLDARLQEAGRKPGDVKRTLMTGVFYGRTREDLEARLGRLRTNPNLKDATADDLIALLRGRGAIAGVGVEIRDQIEEFQRAGVEEIMLQWLDLDDIQRLEALAEALLP